MTVSCVTVRATYADTDASERKAIERIAGHGDLNGDGNVTGADLGLLLTAWS